uniref:Vitellinogen open beta-sheet domain-containing protein n=1 Tax=Romanomermis culicivorax TaxID=13658 RepID=A0A915L692_ROMCU
MMIPFEKDLILKYLRQFAFSLKEDMLQRAILYHLKEMSNKPAIDINFHEAMLLSEKERQIPTSLGVPLNLEITMPMVAKATGSLKLNVEKLDKFSVRVDLNP